MSKAKPTPETWEYGPHGSVSTLGEPFQRVLVEHGDTVVAIVPGEKEAAIPNARTIASAPQGVDLARLVMGYLDAIRDDPTVKFYPSSLETAARKVLAIAEPGEKQ